MQRLHRSQLVGEGRVQAWNSARGQERSPVGRSESAAKRVGSAWAAPRAKQQRISVPEKSGKAGWARGIVRTVPAGRVKRLAESAEIALGKSGVVRENGKTARYASAEHIVFPAQRRILLPLNAVEQATGAASDRGQRVRSDFPRKFLLCGKQERPAVPPVPREPRKEWLRRLRSAPKR